MKLKSLTAKLAALLCACGFVGYAQALLVEGYELPMPEAEVSVKDAAGLAALLERNEEDVAALMSDLGQDWITRFTKENNEPSLTSMSWRTYSTSTKDVFVFQAKDKSEDIMSTYGDWYCDYVVSFDQDVAADSVILTGAYGTQLATILVGMPFEGNNVTKQFLISSMGFNMDYNAIVENVGTFICTAINISRENIGKTINVSLVMWPSTGNKETDSVTITTIPYTFTEANLSSIKIPGDGAEYRFVSTGLDEDGLVCNGSSFVAQTEAGPHFSPVAYVAQIGETMYETVDAALSAAKNPSNAGCTVNIFAGEYTLTSTSYAFADNVTVIGETDSEGNNLVKINNSLTVSANNLTLKNLNILAGSDNNALSYCNFHGNTVIEHCNLSGRCGERYGYIYDNGNVTFKDCVITGSVYGIHFDGNSGTVTIKGCTITGWTSFAGTITKVTIEDSHFAEGAYNYIRFYQDAVIDDCTFNSKMQININTTGKKLLVIDSAFEDGTSVASVVGEGEDDSPIANNYVAVGTDVVLDEDGAITGGLFDIVDATLVAEGYDIMPYGNAKKTVGHAVAQIGDDKYGSLADAIAAVPTTGEETTITMVADETFNKEATLSISDNKNIVLDLNGKTISGSSDLSTANFYFIQVNTGCSLTVKDGSEGAAGKISFASSVKNNFSYERVTVKNIGGTLTLESGTIENVTGSGMAYAVNNAVNCGGSSTFIMTGGTISSVGGDGDLRIYNNAVTSAECHNTVTISGGTLASTGIFCDAYLGGNIPANYTGENVSTTLNITGGTINGLVDFKIRHKYNNNFTISGGDFTNAKLRVRKYTSEYKGDEPTEPMVTITGGKFAFVASNNAFGTSYEYTPTSWAAAYKPYAVSGGVYNFDLNSYSSVKFPEGKTGVANTDELTKDAYPYTVGVAFVPVAQIGETKYETLQAALNAAESGDTVKLLSDVMVSAYVGITKSITLDGDNHILTVNATRGIRVSSGDVSVTIKNLTIPVTSGLERAIQVDPNMDNVALTIDNVTAEATWYTVNICAGVDDLVLKIKSSNLTGYGVANLWGNGNNGSVEIDSSTLTGVNTESYSAWNNFGVIIAEGDTTGQTDLHATAYTITVKDTTIVSTSTYGNKQSAVLFNAQSVGNTVVLDGCTITRGNENCTFFLDNGSANITKVRNTVDDATHELPILPFGYCYAAPDADGYRLITKAVAEVAGEYYATLAEAVAATDEGTINLIRDASGAGIFIGANAGKSITIDFGEYTYTVVGPAVGSKGTESQAFHLEKGNSVTLKNGNVTATADSGVLMLVQNYCDLTLDDIVLDGSENSNISYVVSNNNGSMTATGSTFILAAEGKVAFDVCATSYYPEGVTVTFDSNFEGFVEGKVEYDVWGSIPANNKATLTIEEGNDGWFVIDWQVEEALAQAAKSNFNIAGGTFTTDVPADYCAYGFIPTSFVDEDDGETYYAVRPANYVAQIGSTKYESFAAAVEAVQNDDTIVLLSDTTVAMGYAKSIGEAGYGEGVGANRLVISTDKTFTVNLGGHILMGRINFARGNMTLVNGTIRASSQALNIFGSKDYAYAGEEYSVITIGADVTVDANYGLCVFAGDPGNTYYQLGFGEVFNVYGKVRANSPVYVSGNVGRASDYTDDVKALENTTGKKVYELMALYGPKINIYDGAELVATPSSSASDNSQGISLSGCAIVNVFGGTVSGAEGIGVKGGVLNVSGGTITGTGAKCDPVVAVNSGTEASGAAISASTHYNQNYSIAINVTGGTITSVNNAAFLVAHSVEGGTPEKVVNGISAVIAGGRFAGGAGQDAVIVETALEGEEGRYPANFISGGYFSTKVPANYIVDGKLCTTKPTANGMYQVVPAKTVRYTGTAPAGVTGFALPDPASFTYPSGDLAEIALSLPTYTSGTQGFAGWKVKDSNPAEIIAAIPVGSTKSYELVATWTAVSTVTVQGNTTKEEVPVSVEIKLPDEWLAQTTTVNEVEKANSAALNDTASNGLKVWENYVLGQDPTTAVKVDSEQGGTTVMPVKNTLAVQPVDTGFKVEYSLDKVDVGTGATVADGEGAKQETTDIDLDLKNATANTTTAYFKMTATITKTGATAQEDQVVSKVQSENTIGVLAVKDAPATAIIGVPWKSLSDGGDIKVDNLVRTANLTPGDTITVYGGGKFKQWTLEENEDKTKEWVPVTTVTTSGSEQAGEASENGVACGAGVWLTRQKPEEPIYLVGQATTEATTTTTIEKPTAEAAAAGEKAWNLVASPKVEPLQVTTILEGKSQNDKVIIPTKGSPKNIYWNKKLNKWGYVDYTTNASGYAVPTFVEASEASIPAGTGFWYLNGDSNNDELQWDSDNN